MQRVIFFIGLAILFMLATAGALPDSVASHFDSSGAPNRFMSEQSYLLLILALVVLIPLLIAWLGRWLHQLPDELINLPHKQYWLAPERRTQTLSYLANWLQWSACLLVLFFCYLHWLILDSQQQNPLQLNTLMTTIGLVGYLGAMSVAVIALLYKFLRVPNSGRL